MGKFDAKNPAYLYNTVIFMVDQGLSYIVYFMVYQLPWTFRMTMLWSLVFFPWLIFVVWMFFSIPYILHGLYTIYIYELYWKYDYE